MPQDRSICQRAQRPWWPRLWQFTCPRAHPPIIRWNQTHIFNRWTKCRIGTLAHLQHMIKMFSDNGNVSPPVPGQNLALIEHIWRPLLGRFVRPSLQLFSFKLWNPNLLDSHLCSLDGWTTPSFKVWHSSSYPLNLVHLLISRFPAFLKSRFATFSHMFAPLLL